MQFENKMVILVLKREVQIKTKVDWKVLGEIQMRKENITQQRVNNSA